MVFSLLFCKYNSWWGLRLLTIFCISIAESPGKQGKKKAYFLFNPSQLNYFMYDQTKLVAVGGKEKNKSNKTWEKKKTRMMNRLWCRMTTLRDRCKRWAGSWLGVLGAWRALPLTRSSKLLPLCLVKVLEARGRVLFAVVFSDPSTCRVPPAIGYNSMIVAAENEPQAENETDGPPCSRGRGRLCACGAALSLVAASRVCFIME